VPQLPQITIGAVKIVLALKHSTESHLRRHEQVDPHLPQKQVSWPNDVSTASKELPLRDGIACRHSALGRSRGRSRPRQSAHLTRLLLGEVVDAGSCFRWSLFNRGYAALVVIMTRCGLYESQNVTNCKKDRNSVRIACLCLRQAVKEENDKSASSKTQKIAKKHCRQDALTYKTETLFMRTSYWAQILQHNRMDLLLSLSKNGASFSTGYRQSPYSTRSSYLMHSLFGPTYVWGSCTC